jgi:hypothetical protein
MLIQFLDVEQFEEMLGIIGNIFLAGGWRIFNLRCRRPDLHCRQRSTEPHK